MCMNTSNMHIFSGASPMLTWISFFFDHLDDFTFSGLNSHRKIDVITIDWRIYIESQKFIHWTIWNRKAILARRNPVASSEWLESMYFIVLHVLIWNRSLCHRASFRTYTYIQLRNWFAVCVKYCDFQWEPNWIQPENSINWPFDMCIEIEKSINVHSLRRFAVEPSIAFDALIQLLMCELNWWIAGLAVWTHMHRQTETEKERKFAKYHLLD